jgi:deoxyribodipyrimidine photo-lyase
MRSSGVPSLRLRVVADTPINPNGAFVLHWMIACRRVGWSFALERAIEWVRELDRPLVILEPLRAGYPWASDRLHRFVLDGMADTARRLSGADVTYYPYVEPAPGAGKGLLRALALHAAVCVTDDAPAFVFPGMLAAAGRQVPVRLEAVDGNGLLPLRAADGAFTTAHSFRRFLQRRLPHHLGLGPSADPLARRRLPRLRSLPRDVTTRWPPAAPAVLAGRPEALADLPIDHSVGPVDTRGGTTAARAALSRFLKVRLARYASERNQPDEEVTSGLSPYLHFGHLAAHEVFAGIARAEDWTGGELAPTATGSRRGWWGMGEAAEAFLDQLVTWRELGFNTCAHRADYDRYDSLPDWALRTLGKHARDRRPALYSARQLEAAETHDPLWNAGQLQLAREGRLHNYIRMLWGKKILEWSTSPEEALAVMVDLNNKYALDGRDPNSWSGIFWVLGRYDRPWGPERPVFGTVRYMSSENTARKLRVRGYLERYAGPRR